MRENIQIGKQIRAARNTKKLSQAQLAEMIGCSCKTISNIENDKPPELKQLVNICDVLDLSLDTLLDLGTRKVSSGVEGSDLVKREVLKQKLSVEDFQNLNTILEQIYLLNSNQIKALKLIIELWK